MIHHETKPTTDRRMLTWAVIGTLVLNVFSVPLFFVLPSDEDVPTGAIVLGFVLAAFGAVGAYGLWKQHRWGWRTTFWVTVLNVVTSLPAIAAWPSAAIGITVIIAIVLGVVEIVVLRRPDVRDIMA